MRAKKCGKICNIVLIQLQYTGDNITNTNPFSLLSLRNGNSNAHVTCTIYLLSIAEKKLRIVQLHTSFFLVYPFIYFFMLQPKSSFVVFCKSLEKIWGYGVLSSKIALVRIKNGFFYKYGHYSSLPDFESNSNELFSFQIFIFYSHSIQNHSALPKTQGTMD